MRDVNWKRVDGKIGLVTIIIFPIISLILFLAKPIIHDCKMTVPSEIKTFSCISSHTNFPSTSSPGINNPRSLQMRAACISDITEMVIVEQYQNRMKYMGDQILVAWFSRCWQQIERGRERFMISNYFSYDYLKPMAGPTP